LLSSALLFLAEGDVMGGRLSLERDNIPFFQEFIIEQLEDRIVLDGAGALDSTDQAYSGSDTVDNLGWVYVENGWWFNDDGQGWWYCQDTNWWWNQNTDWWFQNSGVLGFWYLDDNHYFAEEYSTGNWYWWDNIGHQIWELAFVWWWDASLDGWVYNDWNDSQYHWGDLHYFHQDHNTMGWAWFDAVNDNAWEPYLTWFTDSFGVWVINAWDESHYYWGDNFLYVQQHTSMLVNDEPVTILPGDQAVNEDTDLQIPGIWIYDVDSGNAQIQMTLSVTHGTLTLADTSLISFVTGDGTQDTQMVFQGTWNQLNDWLRDVVYRPVSNFHGSDWLVIVLDDLGNSGSGGNRTISESVSITVTPLNDGPANSTPSIAQTFEGSLTFGAAYGNQISIFDVDAGTDSIQVTLTTADGILLLGSVPSGLTVTGDGTGTMTLLGSQNNINLALEGLRYNPEEGFAGESTIQIVTDDLGHNGSGTHLIDTDIIYMNVNYRIVESVGYWVVYMQDTHYTAQDRNEIIYGTAGDDTIDALGAASRYIIYGGNGSDTIFGGASADVIYGGNGNDRIHGGSGADHLFGGNDDDWFYVDSFDPRYLGDPGDSFYYDPDLSMVVRREINNYDAQGNWIRSEIWDDTSMDPLHDHSIWFQYFGTWYCQCHQDGLPNCEQMSEIGILEALTLNDYDVQEWTNWAEINGWYDPNPATGGTDHEGLGRILEHFGYDITRGYAAYGSADWLIAQLATLISQGRVIVIGDHWELSGHPSSPGIQHALHDVQAVAVSYGYNGSPTSVGIIDSMMYNQGITWLSVDGFIQAWADSGYQYCLVS
jgi:hypothetical protein